jgi:hypothetical protein
MAKGPGPLAGLAHDPDMGLIGPGIPEPSADAVLAKSFNLDIPASVFDMVMNHFFQHPGRNSFIVFLTG